jgi:hypothetical protein
MAYFFYVQASGGDIRGYENLEISGFEKIYNAQSLSLTKVSSKSLDGITVTLELYF